MTPKGGSYYSKKKDVARNALNGHDEGVGEGEPVSLLLPFNLLREIDEGSIKFQPPQSIQCAVIVVHKLGVVAQILALHHHHQEGVGFEWWS